MDHFPRVPAYNCLNIIQVLVQLILVNQMYVGQYAQSFVFLPLLYQAATQLLSATMIIHAHSVPVSASSLLLCPWFIVLVLSGAVERLSGVALGVAMERDWVVQVLLFWPFLVPLSYNMHMHAHSFVLPSHHVSDKHSRANSWQEWTGLLHSHKQMPFLVELIYCVRYLLILWSSFLLKYLSAFYVHQVISDISLKIWYAVLKLKISYGLFFLNFQLINMLWVVIYLKLEEICAFIYLQIAGASLFGILISKYDPVTCLKFATGLMAWSLPFAVMLFSLLFLSFLLG